MLITSCVDAVRLQNGVLVDARVLNIDVVERGEVGDAVYFTYSYEYQGKLYQHRTRRLALFSRSNKPHKKLGTAFQTGSVVQCFVDPDRPSLSVFSKEFSIPLFLVSAILPVAFGGAALLITVSLFRRYRRSRQVH